MTHAHVLQLPRFTDDQALAWIASRSPVQIKCTVLARQFRWHRNTVGKKLQTWVEMGKIERNGGIITVPARVPNVQMHKVRHTDQCASKWSAILLFIIGALIAGVLLMVNVASWHSFAKGTVAAYAFVVLGIAVAVAVMALPACARVADRGTSALLWGMWVFVFVVDVLTSVGFAYGNFGSAVAGTQAGVDRRAFLEARIHSLLTERKRMPEFVPMTSVEDAKAAVARECVKVGTECRKREAELADANRNLGLTEKAAKLAAEVKEAEAEITGIQVIASPDPLTDGVIDLVYQTSGHKLEARAVTTGRNVIFALFLLVPAGFFRGATSLARR